MIQWWWIIPAFVAGALFAVGLFFLIILTDGETDGPHSSDYPIEPRRLA